MGYTFGTATSGIVVGKGTLVYSDQYIIPVGKQYFEICCYGRSTAIITAFSINYGNSNSNVDTLIEIGYWNNGYDYVAVINRSYVKSISVSTPRYIGIAIDFDKCHILEICDSISDIHYDVIPRVKQGVCRFLFHDYQFNTGSGYGTTGFNTNFGESKFHFPIPDGYASVNNVLSCLS